MKSETTPLSKMSPLHRLGESISGYNPNGAFISPNMVKRLQANGYTLPDLNKIRQYRHRRILEQLNKRDVDTLLLFDPINIRYATDSSNMQVWTAHNLARAALITKDGYTVLWDFTHCEHLTDHLTDIDDIRTGAGSFYFEFGDQVEQQANKFFADVRDIMSAQNCGRRIGVDRMDMTIAQAFLSSDLTLIDGQTVMEHARLIKSADEILAMRCAVHGCELSIEAMEKAMKPGMAEVELWSILHAENIAQGGEWIETRLLASGPRTNPWMSEASGRIMNSGEIMAFDTDLIGLFGICCDMSRTWLVGDGDPTDEQRELYQVAAEHIETNTEMLAPGVPLRDLTFNGHVLPEKYQANKYCVKMHGVGLCDEFPSIYYPDHYIEGAVDYHLKPGMVLCVEAFVGAEGGTEGVKLENQVLITEDGHENLTTYPYDRRLMGQ